MFRSYQELAYNYSTVVKIKAPFPESQYLRPTLLAAWNLHKGGTEVMSRILKNTQFRYSGWHPKPRLTLGMILVQFTTAYYLYRIYLTRKYFDSQSHRSLKSYLRWRQEGSTGMSSTKILGKVVKAGFGREIDDQEKRRIPDQWYREALRRRFLDPKDPV